jgi:hypothetical protein
MSDELGRIIKDKNYIYEDEFKDDKCNGLGKITDSYGNIYEGEFKNNLLNG